MTIYCVDDGGDGSQDNTTQGATLDWSKADASIADLISYDAAAFTTAGNVIYIGDDHNDPNKAANWTLTAVASGLPVILISADRTAATPTYKVGSGNQLSGLGGAYSVTIDGAVALYGIRVVAGTGANISHVADANEGCISVGCKFVLGVNAGVSFSTDLVNGRQVVTNFVIDLTADGSSGRSASVIGTGWNAALIGGTFINAAYRTGNIITISTTTYSSILEITACDFSGFTNATLCEIVNSDISAQVVMANCLTASTWSPWTTTTPRRGGTLLATNCGPADAPSALFYKDYYGDIASTSSIYRTGGATVENEVCSWLITTTANVAEGSPFYTPWIYGVVSSTGSRTFTLYITNDTEDFNNSQVWLEVEYLSTTDEAIWALGSDQRDNGTGAFISITEAVDTQTVDTTSTWNEFTGSGTYSQTGTVVTVTDTAHGLRYGDVIVVDVTGTGGVSDGTYTLTSVADADTFTFTASTGNGSGTLTWQMAPLYTYKQSLAVTATVNETGQFRARVAVGVASIASSRYFYVDPAVFVDGVLATSNNLLIPGSGIVGQPATTSGGGVTATIGSPFAG